MENNIPCPYCKSHQRAEQTYCSDCGINMQKAFGTYKEKDEKVEKPKKGTYEKKFLRGFRK